MKVLILGASGIIGSHMRLCIPDGVESIWTRQSLDGFHDRLDIEDTPALVKFLALHTPDVIVNLAGESRTDVVEDNPSAAYPVNVAVPSLLAAWCERRHAHYVHISTQAVFSGSTPPYSPTSERYGVNEYGRQKLQAETVVQRCSSRWTIVRPTFVLGVRPAPAIGRTNPIEQMIEAKGVSSQVVDRHFSVSFARTVASELWKIALADPQMKAVHIGIPHGVSRYDIAGLVRGQCVEAVTHDSFPGIAPRPMDTSFADENGRYTIENGDLHMQDLQSGRARALLIRAGINSCKQEFIDRESLTIAQRAKELSIFTDLRADVCLEKLSTGFHALHAGVAADFRGADTSTPEGLLNWYRTTQAYCWELSAYHCDAGVPAPGWNYSGMCEGIAEKLTASKVKTVLSLGDGIGDLTLSLARRGFDAWYHDLFGSETARFANTRFWMYLGRQIPFDMTATWEPNFGTEKYDAITSMDFLEHVTDVEKWVRAIYRSLRHGGLLCAQNAFGAGSGPDGSIPMHLTVNDRFEKDWDPLLHEIGFIQESSNWYRKP